MDQFKSENELIGFRNNEPVLRKINLEQNVERKSVVLTGSSFNNIIVLKNNKNVRIPVKLCTMVPENVRKAVLNQLPNIKIKDNERAEAKSYLSINRVFDKEFCSKNETGTSHESFVSIKKEPEDIEIQQNQLVKNEKQEDLNKTIKKDLYPKVCLKNFKTTNNIRSKNQHPKRTSLNNINMDVNQRKCNLKKTNINVKKKVLRRSSSNQQQQRTLQNIVRYLKNQKAKMKTRKALMKRSISCQTEAFTNEISCQTDKTSDINDDLLSIDMLSLFENTEKNMILGSPLHSMNFPDSSRTSPAHPSSLSLGVGGQFPFMNQGNQFGGLVQNGMQSVGIVGNPGNEINMNLDPKKMKFYESLKNCDCPDAAGHIPLHLAVLHNNRAEVHNQCLLLKVRKFSIDIPNNQGMTPLHLAVLNESEIEIIKLLLANGADPLMKDGEGNTSLHNAIQSNGNDEDQILMTLLTHLKKTKENVDVFNYEGFTPLMLCVIEDKYKMALNCIAAGADPNTKDQKSGRTSLFHAVENNNLKMVKLFMKTGANTKLKNFFGTSTHEATFELESINPEIKSLIIGKEMTANRAKISVAKKKKKIHEAKVSEIPSYKNKLKTVRILKIIEKDLRK